MSNYPPPAGFSSQPTYPGGFSGGVQYFGGNSAYMMSSAPPQMGASHGPSSAYYSGHPTVVPAPNFDPAKDADELRKAMRGLGTDEDRIIAVLSQRTSAQRTEIVNKYLACFGKDLKKDLKSDLSGKFEDVVLASIMDLPTMLATSLYNAMKGAGTKEWVLIQVLVPYSNAIVKATVEAYHKNFNRKLEDDIRGDTSGDFEKILVALMQGCREENAPLDMARAQTDADELYAAGEKRLGTEEAVFTRVLTQRSFGQIKAISECYGKKYGKSLEKAIKKETSGYYEKTMVSIVRFAEDKNDLLAEWFHDSMAGLGTRDEMLMRLVLGRCEIDLQDVKDAYMRKYNKPLVKAIEDDTSGDYRKMLVALVGP